MCVCVRELCDRIQISNIPPLGSQTICPPPSESIALPVRSTCVCVHGSVCLSVYIYIYICVHYMLVFIFLHMRMPKPPCMPRVRLARARVRVRIRARVMGLNSIKVGARVGLPEPLTDNMAVLALALKDITI